MKSLNKSSEVSIVIPFYNMGGFIEEAIASVRRQTIKGFEVIIVNDGSNDHESIEVLERFRDASDIIVIDQKNKGLSAARNAGVRAAKGKYISCLDADDLLNPSFVEDCILEFERDKKNEAAFIGVYTRLFGLRADLWKPLEFDPVKLLRLNFFHSATMFRKSAWSKVGGFDENMKKGYEDWSFWISLVEAGYTWRVVKKELTRYRIRPNSMVVNANKFHGELYSYIVNHHPKIFDLYGSELIKVLMTAIAEKDDLLDHRDELIAVVQNSAYNENKYLLRKVNALEKVLNSYRTNILIKVGRKINLIKEPNVKWPKQLKRKTKTRAK